MHNWIKNNQKKLLAVFGVLLMVVFILPTAPQMLQSYDTPVGMAGNQKVLRSEMAQAHMQWEFIASRIAPQAMYLFGGNELWPMVMFSAKTVSAINQDPALFLLMQHEARAMDIHVSPEEVDLYVGRLNTMLPPASSWDEAQARRQSIQSLLLVGQAFDRVSSVIKVSQPRVNQEVAEQSQSVQLKLIEFTAASFTADIPAPTDEEVQAQITKFGSVDPQQIDVQTNPFGLSYRLPDRVKLQYLVIPRTQFHEQAEKSQTEFDWRSQAYDWYERHPKQYETTEPATQESSFDDKADLTLGPTTAPTSQPTATTTHLRPFDEVYGQIKTDLLKPLVDQRVRQVQDRVASLLQKGFEQYEAKKDGRTLSGSTGLSAEYSSYDYLLQVAQQIEREYDITLTVQEISNRWLSEGDLMGLAELGSAVVPGINNSAPTPFANYVLSQAQAFQENPDKNSFDSLKIFQPSTALLSVGQDVIFFRLTDAQPAHAPETDEQRQEVAGAAARDLQNIAAYNKALEAAKAAYQAAQDGQSLTEVAQGRKIIETGPISRMYRSFGGGTLIQDYSVGAASREIFGDKAFGLLHDATTERRHPKTLIELPRDGKVDLAELDSINHLQSGDANELLIRSTNQARISDLISLAMDWFNPDSIRQRTQWKAL